MGEISELEDEKNTIRSKIARGIRIRGQNFSIPSVSSPKLDFKFREKYFLRNIFC